MKHLWPEFWPVLKVATVFFTLCLMLLLYRHYSLYDSYDQGLFNQVFWNSVQGRLFESSLSSALSADVTLSGNLPSVSYRHLGQHFNPIFLLWMPFYALFPSPITLIVVQVTLVTGAGLMLYVLARERLEPKISVMIAVSFYGANAVLGSTLGNFHDYAPLPLLMFTLFLALEKQWWLLFWGMAVLILSVREDAGVALLSVGVYLVVSRRYPQLGLAISTLSVAYVLALTNVVMPYFSPDVSQRFIVERFGQYTDGKPTSSGDAILQILSRPHIIVKELFSRFPKKLNYLLGHWLPLGFIPAISVDSWLVAGFPLLQFLLMKGDSPLSMNIRYVMLVVPGLYYGAILWWSKHPKSFKSPIRQFWTLCLGLSFLFAINTNPNKTLSFFIPDSIYPWVYVSLTDQIQHLTPVNTILAQIPPQASVAATTNLIPPLSNRREIVRFPDFLQFRNDTGQIKNVEFIVADLWRLQQYLPAFKGDRSTLEDIVKLIDRITQNQEYGILDFQEGVILLGKGSPPQDKALASWLHFREHIISSIVNYQKN